MPTRTKGTKGTKKTGNRKAIVLGLRATAEQRAWMNMAAAERRLSLQGLFDEIMMQYAGSPWLPKSDTLIAVPVEEKTLITRITEFVRKRQKKPNLVSMFETVFRAMEVSMEEATR